MNTESDRKDEKTDEMEYSITIKSIVMNWGNKLLLVFVGFGSFMSFMVYRCMQAPVNLVAKEYYRDELAYQQVIDGKALAQTLSSDVHLQQSADSISIQLPAEMKALPIKGQVTFYCAADARKDRQFDLQPNSTALQQLPNKLVLPGQYLVKVDWLVGDARYYSETPFTVQ